MPWFNKTEEEIIERLKNVLRTEDFQFIGRYESVPQKDFGFFKDVRSLSGVRKFYPKNDGFTDENKLRPLEIYTKAYDQLEDSKWYKFYVVPAPNQLKRDKNNPFLLQTDWRRVRDILLLKGEELIENIKNDAVKTPEAIAGNLMRAIETISIDINTEPTTFIFELIQNADDYPNSDNNVSITFQIDNSYLIIKHNGSDFEVNNTVALCGINEGDKREDTNKIGFKGIGFKSIFKDANFAYIKSGDFSFKFDEEYWRSRGIPMFWHITPINTPIDEYKQVLKSESNVNIVVKPRASQTLQTYKDTFTTHFNDERILLFLRNVKSLIFDSRGDNFEIFNSSEKWKILTESNIEIPEKETEELNRKINFPDKRIPVKFYDVTLTELGFGFKTNQNKVELIDDAFIYAYLPTRVNLGFSFIINGNFIPDASRTKIYNDITWNTFLFEKAGELFINQIIALLNAGYEKESVLKQIPYFPEILQNIKDEDKIIFINCFKNGFEKKVITQHFIPTQSGSLETLSNILIDETGLANLLKEQFSTLTGITGKLIHNDIGEGVVKVKQLINEYKVGTIFKIENLTDVLKKSEFQEWLKVPENNFQIISHFYSRDDLKDLLKTEDVVLDSNNKLTKSTSLYKSIPKELSFLAVSVINSELLSRLEENELSIELLEFEPTKFYKEEILGDEQSIDSLLVSENSLLNFWRFVYDNWEDFEKVKEITDSIKKLSILCKSTENDVVTQKITSSYLSVEFDSDSSIETVIESIGITNIHFISEKYITEQYKAEQWRKIFEKVGAITNLQQVIEKLIPKLSSIKEQSHFEIGKQIFLYWKKNRNNESKKLNHEQIQNVKEHLKIKCIDGSFIQGNECFISDHYTTNPIISEILPEIKLQEILISDEYIKQENFLKEWSEFFKDIVGCQLLSEKKDVFETKVGYLIEHQDNFREKHFEILKALSKLYKEKNDNKFSFDKLSELKLKTNTEDWLLPNQIHLSSVYKPKLDLQKDEEICNEFVFLKEEYVPSNISKLLLSKIGVRSNFKFEMMEKPIKYIEFDNENIKNILFRGEGFKNKKDALLKRYNLDQIKLYTTFNHHTRCYPKLSIEIIQKWSKPFFEELLELEENVFKPTLLVNNGIVYDSCDNELISFIKENETVENSEGVFVKPTTLFSFSLSNYTDNKAILPKTDYRNNIILEKSFEELIGIQQKLSEDYCIQLLCRKENQISLEEVKELNIVEILKDFVPISEKKDKLLLLNKNEKWESLNKLCYTNEQFEIDHDKFLHEYFHSIADNFDIPKLSESIYERRTEPESPTINNDIKERFREKAKFIAFKIDPTNYKDIEQGLIDNINQYDFYEAESMEKVFPSIDKSIYKENIDFLPKPDKKEIFYTGDWDRNKNVVNFLFDLIPEGNITKKWFENVITRWDDEKIIEVLKDEFGETPFKTNSENIDIDKGEIWADISEADEKFIRGIIQDEYELNEKLDVNKTAKIKTLIAIRDQYNDIEITDEGRFLKAGLDEILVRSAQNGLLYLDVYNWERLSESNVKLSVYTNNTINLFESQEDLIKFTNPKNKFGIVRMPNEYSVDDYNSLDNILNKDKWHYVFIVNEDTEIAKNYKEVMDYSDPNLFDNDKF